MPYIFGLIVLIIVVVIAMAAMKPAAFRIARCVTMNTTPDTIFVLLNDFHNWASWSPWEKLDPNLQRTFTGAASGKGSVYEWSGNKKAGTGRMEILDSTPTKITIQLDFIKPFTAHNMIECTLEPKGSTTEMTWAMTGNNNFIAKLFGMVMNMDKLVGKDFETGLANLKAQVEK